MSVTLAYKSEITVSETLVTNVPFAPAPTISHSGLNTTKALNGASSPAVSQVAAFTKALVAGAGTIDLTALPGTNGATVDGTGLKVVALKLRPKSTNANPITVKKGVTNGYTMLA